MILEKRYPYGGKPTNKWGGKIVEDNGVICVRIGFVPRDTLIKQGEPVCIPLMEIRQFCDDLGVDLNGVEEKDTIKIKLAKKFLGRELETIIHRAEQDTP